MGGGRADSTRSGQVTVKQLERLLTAVTIALLVLAGSLFYQRWANRGVSPTVRDSIAVIKASKTPDSVAHAALIAQAETVKAVSKTIERHAQVHKQRADSAATLAAISTTAQDSATHWHTAYLEEKARADSLEGALAEERKATILAQRADSASQARLVRVERLNADVTSELARVSSGCHLLPGIRCPTRKETAVVAVAATYLALGGQLGIRPH